MSLTRPSCPYCGNSPRYGFEKHKQTCHKRPVTAPEVKAALDAMPEMHPNDVTFVGDFSFAKPINNPQRWSDHREWEAADRDEEARHGAPPPAEGVSCPKCGKALKKRGAHFHINKCKGR